MIKANFGTEGEHMPGLGTILNVIGIVLGGLIGKLFGRFLPERAQETLEKVCGVSVLFIGIAGALEGMLTVDGASVMSGRGLFLVIALAIGALLGEALNLERRIEQFGEWLKKKTGNAKDKQFVNGFVTASLTVSIGAMAIVGAIEDGLFGDYSVLATKAILDFIIVLVMTCSMGVGCLFSAIPVAALQGAVTLLSRLVEPIMTEAALANLSLVGSVLIFCVGVNLVWGRKVRVANLLPAVVVAVAMAFLPLNL